MRKVWGTNVTHSLEAINNQAVNGLLRTWKWWDINYSGSYAPIQMSPAATQQMYYFGQFNTQPSAPTSFQNSSSSGAVNLSWASNPETDILHYEIERRIINNGGWIVIGTTTSTSFTDNEFNVTAPRWATHTAEYRIRVKSTAMLYSAYSSMVSVQGISYWGQKRQLSSQHIPTEFSLEQNYPNPFNPNTEIIYSVAEPSFVTINVYNSAGQEVAQLAKEFHETGRYTISWNASNMPSGIYICSFSSGKFNSQKKMTLLK